MAWTELIGDGINNDELMEIQILHTRIGQVVAPGTIAMVESGQEVHLHSVGSDQPEFKDLRCILTGEAGGMSFDEGFEGPKSYLSETTRWLRERNKLDGEADRAAQILQSRIDAWFEEEGRERIQRVGQFIVQNPGMLIIVQPEDSESQQLITGDHLNVARLRAIQLHRDKNSVSAFAVTERTIGGLGILSRRLEPTSILVTVPE